MEQTNHLLMTSMGSADIDRYSIASFEYFAEKFTRISKNCGFSLTLFYEINFSNAVFISKVVCLTV